MIKHYLKAVILIFLVLNNIFIKAQVISTFTSVYQTHQRGGIVFLSNSALGCSANPPVATGTCALASQETVLGTTHNDDYLAAYIDVDGDASTFMSSSDSLHLPSCSQITKAFLFWGATGNASSGLNQIKIKLNGGSYQSVVATSSLSNSTGFNSYHCYADVTSLLTTMGSNARITVADIPSSGIGSANVFGSWNLVIVYKNDLMNMRHLNVYNGLANVSTLSPLINIPLSGFSTPTTGAVSFEIGAYSHDGDRGTGTDGISFNGNLTFLAMTDLSNPVGDAMNSTVSNNGVANLFRKPLLLNTTGSDADIYAPINLLNVYLNNAATTATVQLTTATDNYLTQVLTSAIDSYEPDLRVTVKASDVNGGTLNPGETVRYRVTGYNVGSDKSTNTAITCTLDPNVNYVANSTSVVFGSNTGAKTDAAADDEVDYNSTTHVLKIRIGSGASSTSGGTVTNSATGLDSTVVTYSVIVSSSCLKLSCNNTFTASANISGVGGVLSHTANSMSTPGTSTTNGCPVFGVTTTTVSVSTCAAPSATNSSPACSGGNITLNASNDSEAIYSWSGPNSFTATGMTPTITAVTTTISGVYTVTLSIPSIASCTAVATTSVTITNCPPVANTDFTTTVVNTSVIGNAAANDLNGTPNGTFVILTQPASGTLSINPATGIYSFTPATNFTGATSATYQICNGLPVNCSTAAINFTVYPLLVANADLIYTTPLTATSGTLLSNDTGITPGASYSVSVTQPAITTGSINFNPATGQYTFTPGALFNGTAQATYTVCNISVNPQQCSGATITINVSNLPIAIDDGTTTIINTPVTGDASSNDSGTFGGSYTFATINPSTGTLTGNLLGQYSFSPAAGFTGTTSVTYTLCNLSPPPCSTATITFTVYPAVSAVADAIVTTPSTTSNGSLLTNDIGITTGASYSVSISQLPASTGTLLVDPATGSYTFIPASTFTGVAQTSYTVCNVSVNPQQCSSATISIAVGNFPLAANDATYTLINTTVNGDVSINDTNILGGTFTFGNPSSGTLTTNAVTGQYTFMPATGFTGTVSVTYTLCTAVSPPCSTALLTFTVYPVLIANPDIIVAVINTSVTGNITTNDTGIVPAGSYSVLVSPILVTVGNLNVNIASGQFTFIPFPGFTGSTTTSYTLSQYVSALQIQTSVTTITIVVTNGGSAIGVAKSIEKVNYVNNGTIELTYKLVLKNYSNQVLQNVSLSDDLSATFPAPSTYTLISTPVLKSLPLSQLTVNNNFTGSGISKDLLIAGAAKLAPGRSDTVVFTVAVDPHDSQFSYSNSAMASAAMADSSVSDVSVSGINPDPDNDGDPGNNTSPTTFTYNLVKIGIAKSAGRSQSIGNSIYEVTFKFTVKNYGASGIYNVLVVDNLNATFGSSANYTVVGAPRSNNGFLIPDNSYNGSGNNNLVQSGSQLAFGATDTLFLDVKYHSTQIITYSNSATAYAYGIPNGGFIGYDISTSGTNPDLNNNNSARDDGEDQPTLFEPSEDLEIPQGFSPNGDGVNDRFEIKGVKDYPDMEVSILNRWGSLVYNKSNYDNSWDGKAKDGLQYGGNELPEGTYFYIIDLGNDQKPVKGYIYLNRSVR